MTFLYVFPVLCYMFNLNCTYRVRSKMTSPTLTSNSQKCFCTVFKKITYSCRNIFQIFLNFRQDVKNVVLISVLIYSCQKSGHSVTLLTPPHFRLVLLLLQTTRVWKKSRWAVVRCLVQCQSTFQSVCGPRPGRVWGMVGSHWACSLALFLSGQLVQPRSGQISKTVALYCTSSKYRGSYV